MREGNASQKGSSLLTFDDDRRDIKIMEGLNPFVLIYRFSGSCCQAKFLPPPIQFTAGIFIGLLVWLSCRL